MTSIVVTQALAPLLRSSLGRTEEPIKQAAKPIDYAAESYQDPNNDPDNDPNRRHDRQQADRTKEDVVSERDHVRNHSISGFKVQP
jgi:hypothetical protein